MDKNQIFEQKYARAIEWSNNFKELRHIIGFLFELSYWDNGLPFVRIVEKDLLDRDIIPFKVESIDDIYKIEHCDSGSEEKKLMWYIWLSVKQNIKR